VAMALVAVAAMACSEVVFGVDETQIPEKHVVSRARNELVKILATAQIGKPRKICISRRRDAILICILDFVHAPTQPGSARLGCAWLGVAPKVGVSRARESSLLKKRVSRVDETTLDFRSVCFA